MIVMHPACIISARGHVIGRPDQNQGRVADQRLSPPDDTVILFGEPAGNSPPTITRWFYPGDAVGEEFIYPKSSPAMP
jgi:hypothetical protein